MTDDRDDLLPFPLPFPSLPSRMRGGEGGRWKRDTLEFLPAENSRKRGCRRQCCVDRKMEEGGGGGGGIERVDRISESRHARSCACALSPFVSFFSSFSFFSSPSNPTIGRSTIVRNGSAEWEFSAGRAFPRQGESDSDYFSIVVVENRGGGVVAVVVVVVISGSGGTRRGGRGGRGRDKAGNNKMAAG